MWAMARSSLACCAPRMEAGIEGTRSWLRTTYLLSKPATRSLCASAALALRSHAPRSPR